MASNYSTDEIREMIEALRGDNINKRFNAIANLKIIAHALGQDRTKNELIPYVSETLDNTEEMWAKIAEQLGTFNDEIGGDKHIDCILNLLKQICEIEDSYVQEAATKSLVLVASHIQKTTLASSFFPLLKSMASDQWHPLRCSAATVICATYCMFDTTTQKQLSTLFPPLSTDPVTIVRRSLALALPVFVKTAATQEQRDTVSLVIKTLCTDQSHAVLVEVPLALSCLTADDSQLRAQSAKKVFDSQKWQARAVLIDQLDKVFAGIKSPVIKEIAQASANDSSVEVRTAIARQIPFIFANGDLEDPKAFMMALSADRTSSVREAVAKSLGGLKNADKDLLNRMLSLLLNDTDSAVKIAALSAVAATGVGAAAAGQHIPSLMKFATWRMKVGICKVIPQIAATVSRNDFTANFGGTVASLLQNENADVRIAMTAALAQVAAVYGDDYAKTDAMEVIREAFASRDYQLRQTAIRTIFALKLTSQCAELLTKAAADPVPNVRIALAREASAAKCESILEKLKKDEDKDVAFYANK